MNRHNIFIVVACLMMTCISTSWAWNTYTGVYTYSSNTTTTVESCSSNVTLSSGVDYVITATSSALTGTINITDGKSVVIFQNIKPTTVISSYLSKIKVNDETASNGSNCRVDIYRHGAIVLPYSNTCQPLTVYTALNKGGSSKSDFNVNTAYRALGTWDNAIYSFTLKRGYMVTMANHIDGTGYSHCFIANDADMTVNLPAPLRGSVSFLRIFPWQWPSKKGYAGYDATPMSLMNVTWFYQWNAESYNYENYEYVPQRHHETGTSYTGNTQHWAWPSWSTIDALNGYTHVLGQNEPDNTGSESEVYMTVDDLIELHKYFLYSGMRIGTFATTNPNATWVTNYVNACKARNMRVDFVATHYYKGGQSPTSFISDLAALHTATGLPVWVTEWNNGASWTTETGFTLSDGSYTWGSGDDSAKNGQWLVECLEKADENEWIERLAVYNSVGQKRFVHWETDAHWTTTAGAKYGAYQSKLAYDPSNEVFMEWVNSAPTGLSGGLTIDGDVRLTWQNPNTDCVRTVTVQRKNGSNWTDVTTDNTVLDSESRTIEFTYANYSGTTFRIRNTNADGTYSYSEEYVFPTNAIRGMTQIATLPSDIENYYFRFNSAASSTDLCWGLADGVIQTGYKAVQYVTPTVDGSDTGMKQTWQLTTNGSGYAINSVAHEAQVLASPNSWNFRTNDTHSSTDSKAAYLPAYDSSNSYWTVQNLGHSNCYCGVWNNTSNSATWSFTAGDELAGNRNATGADHLTLYAMKRQDVHQMRITNKGLPTDLTYAISNPAFMWGTYSSAAQGSGSNNIPNQWNFNKTFSGHNDSKLVDATISNTTVKAFNTWAGGFTYAELSQTITSLPNGVYHISADFATTNGYDALKTMTAVYGAPTNSEYIGRSENISGTGDNSFTTYDVYVQVDDNTLTIGARSDGTWFKVANFKLEYMGTTSQVISEILDKIEQGRTRQQLFLLSSRMKTALANAATANDKPMYKVTKSTMNNWVTTVNQDYANENVESLTNDLASLESAVTMANQSAAVYATLKSEMDASQTKHSTYSRTAGESVYNTAYNSVNTNYLAGEYLDEEIPAQIIKVKEFTNLYLMSDLASDATVSPSNPADITDFILENLPLTDNVSAWMTSGTTQTAANENGVEFYNKNFTMQQSVYGLPSGFYKLTTQAFYRYGGQANHYSNYTARTLSPNAVLYINSADGNHTATGPIAYISDAPSSDTSTGNWTSNYIDTYGGSVPNDMTSAGYAFGTLTLYQPTDNYNTVTGRQTFAEGEPMQFGAKKETLVTNDWTIFYTFHLYYLGNTITLDETSETQPDTYRDVNVDFHRTIINKYNNSTEGHAWNTICFPFNLTSAQISDLFGSGAIVKRLKQVDYSGENASLTFEAVNEIEANHPYIMQVDEGNTAYTIANVDVVPTTELTQHVDGVQFIGNYVYPKVMENSSSSEDGTDYYILNDLFKSSTGRTKIKGYRAYFFIPRSSGVKAMGFAPEWDEDATGVLIIEDNDTDDNEPLYNLAGQRVNSTYKGIVIKKGEKKLLK